MMICMNRNMQIEEKLKLYMGTKKEQLALIEEFRKKIQNSDSSTRLSDRHYNAIDDMYNEVFVKFAEIDEKAQDYLLDILKEAK